MSIQCQAKNIKFLYQIVKYIVFVLGLTVGLESVGVDITILVAGSAALLVGIGLGLQQVFYDLVSGVIILFERTIKVGDIIEGYEEIEVKRTIK